MDRARRKKLVQAYKLALPPMGIFAIRNLVTGRMLIDQSNHVTGTLNRHRTELKLGTHRNRALMDDWRMHGETAFAFEVLETIDERPEPDFDYRGELERRLAIWRTQLPTGSPASYL
ncbi:GIY-YIG nuclease family protein [Dyella telluris]|uniref:GIY-YIG nuclease family protein n=1 Tax=Dyella telluris TaxID=2763498 RepID=A0A7G8Q3X0_9GAMM|nr:GIY-YIG nuclease family protein [Dyella telluris]QNK01478.1 GIY-YIG nuclease family protein [Dyella telluris]